MLFRGFNTKCVHAEKTLNIEAEKYTQQYGVAGSSNGLSSLFSGDHERKAAEQSMNLLEKTKYTLALSSGTAAAMLVAHLLEPGDHLIASKDIYCGFVKSFMNLHSMENEITYVDFDDYSKFKASFKENTKV